MQQPNPPPVVDTPRAALVMPEIPKAAPSPVVGNSASTTADSVPPKSSPLEVGSLIGYATQQATPVYPAAARTIRATGIVKVELTVDESGTVASVGRATGPSLLQNSAKDAIRKWKFKPFLRDGQPVKANGFVNFNFNL